MTHHHVKKYLWCGWRVGLDTEGDIGQADVIWSFEHLRLAPDIVFSIQIEEGNLLALYKPWVTLYKLSSEICDEHSNKTRPNTKTFYLLFNKLLQFPCSHGSMCFFGTSSKWFSNIGYKIIFHKNREISILTIKKKTARLTLLQEATERTS
jgi:hypothetical protein